MGSRLETSSTNVRKRIEKHRFEDEGGEEYEGSTFGGFADYMRRKKIKLQNLDAELRSQSSYKPTIFKGIVAHVNGYTQPSLADLHKLIVTHGGGFLQYLDGKTVATHVIASNLTPRKKVEFARYRIVKPTWVVDSVDAGKLLPWDAYRLVDEGVTQKVLTFDGGRMVSQSNTQQSGYRDQTENSWYARQFCSDAGESSQSRNLRPISEPATENAAVIRNESLSLSVPSERIGIQDGMSAEPADTSKVQETATGDHDEDINRESNLAQVEHDTAPNVSYPGTETGDSKLPRSRDRSRTVSAASRSPVDRMTEHPQPSLLEKSYQSSDSVSPGAAKLTAEEHNARLLSDPHLAKSSTANPNFLNQYYRESRLHHLSTWKAELKAQLQAMANERTSSQTSRLKRAPGARRYIMHVDFDSFFAAVSLRKHPQLVEKPVVIAHSSGPGSEIASCNYPARKFGVKNGMWMKTALQLCPELKTLPYDYKGYEEASRHFYEAIIATEGLVQSVSIDEALVDISGMCNAAGGSDGKGISEASLGREQAKADEIATNLRELILEKTGCHVSIGVGANILLAKLALRKAKPAGQHQVKPEEVLDFIAELTVQSLPGVAYSLGGKLEEIGVKYVKDIRNLSKERLIGALGPKTADKLWDYSRGIDKAEVGDEVVRKSVSAEVNWGIRFVTQQQAEEFVQCLCDELSRRLLEQGLRGRQMTMKIMRRSGDAPLDPPKSLGHGKCDTFNKSILLGVATNDATILGKEAASILKAFGFSPGELRGLGVQMQKVEPLKATGNLFSSNPESSQRRLQFKSPTTTSSLLGPEDPPRSRRSPTSAPMSTSSKIGKIQDHPDPIERSPTPEGNTGAKIIQGAVPTTQPTWPDTSYKPLNIMGTQFVLPTQVDPSVLAELPSDIRSKLAPNQKSIVDAFTGNPISRPPPPQSRSVSPSHSPAVLPNQSQIDPQILDELPEEVRNELLSFYQADAARAKLQHQRKPLTSPSPRKPTSAHPIDNVSVTPTKTKKNPAVGRGRGRPPKTNTKASSNSTFIQSNFISHNKRNLVNGHAGPSLATDVSVSATNGDNNSGSTTEPVEISESFLSALPPDMRAEIVADQKRQRLRQRSRLDLGSVHNDSKKHHHTTLETGAGISAQRKLHLVSAPPREPIPTFTSRKLSKIEDLREAVSAWVREFSRTTPAATAAPADADADADAINNSPLEPPTRADDPDPDSEPTTITAGPYPEDVDALALYLRQVVTREHNMEKAVAVVRWLEWKISELEEEASGSDDDDNNNSSGGSGDGDNSGGGDSSDSVDERRRSKSKRRRSPGLGSDPWTGVLARLKHVVRQAVRERGVEGWLDF